MKRIHFDTMKNWIWIVILVLSFVFILGGTFEFFEFKNPKTNKTISAMGFLLQVFYFTKMFWYKNYVQWNNKGAVIKINSFRTKSLNFNQIKTTALIEKMLIITQVNGSKVMFNLNEIAESDVQKLNEILLKNTAITRSST